MMKRMRKARASFSSGDHDVNSMKPVQSQTREQRLNTSLPFLAMFDTSRFICALALQTPPHEPHNQSSNLERSINNEFGPTTHINHSPASPPSKCTRHRQWRPYTGCVSVLKAVIHHYCLTPVLIVAINVNHMHKLPIRLGLCP